MSRTCVIEILQRALKGRRFIPKNYPTLGGTVSDVIQRSDTDAGNWPVIVFEEPEAGVNGGYAVHDLEESFTLEPNVDRCTSEERAVIDAAQRYHEMRLMQGGTKRSLSDLLKAVDAMIAVKSKESLS